MEFMKKKKRNIDWVQQLIFKGNESKTVKNKPSKSAEREICN